MNQLIRHNIGDRVVALTNPFNYRCQPRTKGHIYTVLDTMYCIKCGIQAINIVSHHIHPYGRKWSNLVDCECGSSKPTNDKFWTLSHHFASLDNLSSAIEEAEEAEQSEDYELAELLTNIAQEELVKTIL